MNLSTKKGNHTRLRTKILLSVGLIIFAVLGTSTFMHLRNMRKDYLHAIEWRAEALVQGILHDINIKFQYSQFYDVDIQGLLEGLTVQCIDLYETNKEKGIAHLAVINEESMIAAHSEETLWDTPVENPDLREHLQQRSVLTLPGQDAYHTLIPIIVQENRYLGTIDIGTSRYVIDEKIRELLMQSQGIFLISLIFAFFAITFLVHLFITRPIRHIVTTGEKIAVGELRQIDKISHNWRHSSLTSSQEIEVLTTAFNEIIAYLQEIAQAASRIAHGDLRQTITPHSEHDVLGCAFQRMAAYLSRMAAVATAIAHGDLRQEIDLQYEHDILGKAFYEMKTLRETVGHIIEETKRIRYAADTLADISIQMAADARHTSQQVQSISATSRQVSQNMHSVSVATQEMSANIQAISHNVADVADVTSHAVESSKIGNSKLSDLETRSQEIGDITRLITTITTQTNLLALNATIEAARAGDAGKGFTIVAHEIKELSQQIANATEEIGRKIEAMQTSTSGVTEAISDISDIILRVDNISHEISASIEEQSATTNHISQAIEEASQRSSDVTTAILDVAQISQKTMERAISLQEASEDLSALADQLQQIVGKFQT